MKTSELIEWLQTAMDKMGDMPCYMEIEDNETILPVSQVLVETDEETNECRVMLSEVPFLYEV